MGNSRYSHVDWDRHTKSSYAGKSTHEVFTETRLHPDLDAGKVAPRECRDSAANPNARPIILASDVTGSMGYTANEIIQKHLGGVFNMLYDRKPVSDPQIMCAAIGDTTCDRAPLQITQFEADGVTLAKQLEKVYVEQGGGGNGGESYQALWAFAAYRTKVDAFKKRNQKGYLFTIGDECPLMYTSREHLQEFVGLQDVQAGMDTRELLRHATGDWHIFHLIIKPVPDQPVVATWKDLLGERAIVLENLDNLALGITAIIETIEGQNVSVGRVGTDRLIAERIAEQLVTT